MKPTYSIILFIGSLLLFIGSFRYYSAYQNTRAKVLFETNRSIHRVNDVLRTINQNATDRFQHSKYDDAADFKLLFGELRSIQTAGLNFRKNIRQFNSKLFNLENPFYFFDEEDAEIKFKESTFVSPFYAQEQMQIILKEDAEILHSSYIFFIKKVENTLKDTSLFNSTNNRFLEILKNSNLEALDILKRQMKVLESIEIMQRHYSKLDLSQLQLKLKLLEQYYYIFENTIINNFERIKFELQNAGLDNRGYAFHMNGENKAIIGKDYELQVYLSNYVINETLEMRVNGREIPVKNGIGYYTCKNKKPFYVTTSLINPMTGERDSYGKRFNEY